MTFTQSGIRIPCIRVSTSDSVYACVYACKQSARPGMHIGYRSGCVCISLCTYLYVRVPGWVPGSCVPVCEGERRVRRERDSERKCKVKEV